ncbi:MAG: hypothetical protein KC414_07955, partial [Romboutsia sp.]|nr:hypothetical protein [Romboutsia sp.]
MDLNTGEYINQYECFNKENEFIGEAFKILHFKYIDDWKALIPNIEKLNDITNSLDWNSDTQFLHKIDILKGYTKFYKQNILLIEDFNTTINKFKELMSSSEVKKINKSLKGKKNS